MRREAFLERIGRRASAPGTIPPPPEMAPATLEQFERELTLVGGVLHKLADGDVDSAVAGIAASLRAARFAAWDTPKARRVAEVLMAAGLQRIAPVDPERARIEMAQVDLGVVEADFAICESGTIGLVSGAGRGRLVSALPPALLVILTRDRLLGRLEALAGWLQARGEPPAALALITGVSSTGDVDQRRVVGAQGPSTVHVVLID